MSPENQWLEDASPTEIVPFRGHFICPGCTVKNTWPFRTNPQGLQISFWRQHLPTWDPRSAKATRCPGVSQGLEIFSTKNATQGEPTCSFWDGFHKKSWKVQQGKSPRKIQSWGVLSLAETYSSMSTEKVQSGKLTWNLPPPGISSSNHWFSGDVR